jgi:hypothetical protein
MKRLITAEEAEFIVLQLLDQGKLDEAENILKENGMSGSEWWHLKDMRYHEFHDETHA